MPSADAGSFPAAPRPPFRWPSRVRSRESGLAVAQRVKDPDAARGHGRAAMTSDPGHALLSRPFRPGNPASTNTLMTQQMWRTVSDEVSIR
jgi:hypothetical protein